MSDTEKTYVFMDESGDTGFKLNKGFSRYFVIAAVIFDNPSDIMHVQEVIAGLREQLRFRKNYEFHFNHESQQVRTAFCEVVRECNFSIRAIVIDKEVIRSPHLRNNARDFYNFITKNC